MRKRYLGVVLPVIALAVSLLPGGGLASAQAARAAETRPSPAISAPTAETLATTCENHPGDYQICEVDLDRNCQGESGTWFSVDVDYVVDEVTADMPVGEALCGLHIDGSSDRQGRWWRNMGGLGPYNARLYRYWRGCIDKTGYGGWVCTPWMWGGW